jgi:tryptophan synthase beta chain
VRCLSVEPAACPKLTRGRYAYDHTDSSQASPLQKMYTLGHRFVPPAMHVFGSAVRFADCEGIVPAPESAHAVHGAVVEAARADAAGESRAILFALSGHGLFDMASYESYLAGTMPDVVVSQEELDRSFAQLPAQPEHDLLVR